jgi:hypothetical protein
VAYLSTNLGVLASYFYFVAHTVCYCMSAIHLSGNVWILCLYASVSESCESMVGYTTVLGKCLYDARLFTCHTRVCMKVSNVGGISSRGDNAINRTMVRVVAIIVRVSGDVCKACRVNLLFSCIPLCWAEMNLLQVHNSAIK